LWPQGGEIRKGAFISMGGEGGGGGEGQSISFTLVLIRRTAKHPYTGRREHTSTKYLSSNGGGRQKKRGGHLVRVYGKKGKLLYIII